MRDSFRPRLPTVLLALCACATVAAASLGYPALSSLPALGIALLAGHGYGKERGVVLGALAGVLSQLGAAWKSDLPLPWLSTLEIAAMAGALAWLGGSVRVREWRITALRAQHRRALAELASTAQGTSELVAAAHMPVHRLNAQGNAVPMTQGGQQLTSILAPDALITLQEALQRAIAEQRRIEVDAESDDDDAARHFKLKIAPLPSGEALALLCDVTELQGLRAEIAAAADDTLRAAGHAGQLLATMSHRIRTPMTGVIGMTNVLMETKLSAEQREYTTIIRNSGEALLSILDDVLDLSRTESGTMQLSDEPFALRSMLEEVVELLSSRAQDKGLEIASIIDARVPDWVKGDGGRLRQVITNLLGNAVKFTTQGQVALRVTVVGHDRDAALIRFDVIDTGVGISEEQQKLLFQDFSQASPSIAREYGGTGLGLAISRQIIEAMGGRMLVESAPSQGSTFSFTVRMGTAQSRSTGSFLLPRALAGARVLALQLHPLTRQYLEHELSPFGAHVHALGSLRDAHGRLSRGESFDAVFVELPIGACESEIRQRVAEAQGLARQLPVTVLYALGQRSAVEIARDAGASLCLSRPLRRNTLLDQLGALLGISAKGRGNKKRAPTTSLPAPPLRARILVVEDNLVNQKVAVKTLENLGCVAQVAENGALAVEAVQSADFDLILMDCQMPVLDGFEACRQIRSYEAGFRRIPIIAMTANAMQGDRERCLAAGMDDYVSKPVTPLQLDATLRRWLPAQVAYGHRDAGGQAAGPNQR